MRRRKGITVLTLGIFTGFLIAFSSYSYRAITADAPYEVLEGLPTIIVDAGHGGFDGGATGAGGIVEKEINLQIAQQLCDLLRSCGFDVVMTRTEDISLEDEGLSSVRQRKNSDIHNRLALAKQSGNAILLSIHQNKYTVSKYWGAQVFFGPENAESEKLARAVQEKFRILQPDNTRQYKACGDSVYLIYHAPIPALLVECGFLSNPEEAYLLTTPDYQKKVAFTIFSGLCNYLNLEEVTI